MFKLVVKSKNLSEFETWRVQQFFLEEAEKTCRLFYFATGDRPQYQNVEIRIETVETEPTAP